MKTCKSIWSSSLVAILYSLRWISLSTLDSTLFLSNYKFSHNFIVYIHFFMPNWFARVAVTAIMYKFESFHWANPTRHVQHKSIMVMALFSYMSYISMVDGQTLVEKMNQMPILNAKSMPDYWRDIDRYFIFGCPDEGNDIRESRVHVCEKRVWNTKKKNFLINGRKRDTRVPTLAYLCKFRNRKWI